MEFQTDNILTTHGKKLFPFVFLIAVACLGAIVMFYPWYRDEEAKGSQQQQVALIDVETFFQEETIPPELFPQRKETNKAKSDSRRKELVSYTIKKGDTLADIAKSHGISVVTLQHANGNLSPKRLQIGQKLSVPPSDGILVKVNRGDNLWSICRRYKADLENTLAFNNIDDVKNIRPGDDLFLPGAKPPAVSRTTTRYASKDSGRKTTTTSGLSFRYPIKGRLTSEYGYRRPPMGPSKRKQFHAGIDIAAPRGRTVYAAEDGQVVSSCYAGGLGFAVVISHKSGYTTVYGHNSKLLAKAGQYVKKGQAIALVGSTGRSTGPHVHFEIRKNGKPIDPLSLLR